MKSVSLLLSILALTWSTRTNPVEPDPRNCYAYATGFPYGINPGDLSGMPVLRPNAITVETVRDRAVRDGLVPVDSPEGCEYPCWPVALAVGPRDYHWFRRDGGRWTHKPGFTPIRHTDRQGNAVIDPRTADRGTYSEFGGFFCSCPAGGGS